MLNQNCLSPVKIFVNGNFIYVPCGKCAMCRSFKSSRWVQRLEQESVCWKYVFFITLTYDDTNIPVYHLNKDKSLVDPKTGEFISSDFYDSLTAVEQKYLKRNRKVSHNSSRDVQLFIKRLRYYCNEKSKKARERTFVLRYFVCSEYGPTTHRVHYHGLLFTNSDAASSSMSESVCKSWSFGSIVDCQTVLSSASQYVAQYSNSVADVFPLFKRKEFRPLVLSSKRPPIGSLVYSAEEVQKIFFKSASRIMRPKRGSSEVVYYPVDKYLEDRLFPKVQGFSGFSHLERVALYGVAKFSDAESWDEFRQWCAQRVDNSTLCSVPKTLIFNIRSFVDLLNSDPFHSIRRLWSISSRVCTQCVLFDVSLDTYVSKIEDYYLNKDYDSLKDSYTYMMDSSVDIRSFIWLDQNFVDSFLSYGSPWDCPLWYLYTLDGYSIDYRRFYYDKEYRMSFHPLNCDSHNRYVIDLVSKISVDSHKVKARKEYLRQHPELSLF